MNNLLEEKLGLENNSIVENDLAIQLATSWHEIFCPSLMKWIKEKPKNGFRWESIICDNSGNEAIEQYTSQKAHNYFIMPEDFGYKNTNIYRISSLPKYNDYLLDFYVFPKNMAWSMAFTHESGPKMMNLGPYFSKHPNYNKLQKKNNEAFKAKNA